MPAYDEQRTIGPLVAEARKVVATVVVVDDCSTDRTAERAEESGAVVIRLRTRQGYDRALMAGFAYASTHSFDFMATLDADGQHDPRCLGALFLPLLRGDVQLVLGRRPRAARVAEAVFAAYSRLRFGVSDPLCGMKSYSVRLYDSSHRFRRFESIGSGLALESIRSGATFQEVPIPISERSGSPRFGSSIHANGRILKALANTIRYLG